MHRLRHSPRRAVFLDALGTLIQLHDPWPALRDLLHERHGIEVELEEARRAMRTEMGYYRANCVRAGDRPSLAALRRECAEILRGELAPVLDALDANALEQALLDALRFDPYEDVVPALRRWRAAGLRLVVVSNWDISLHDVLRQTRLDELFDGVLTSAEVGASKPDPAIFAAALELAAVRPSEAVHIGDSAQEDVAGARAAGIEPWLLARAGGGAPAPDGVRTLASLREA
jgi:putative hydrolase of the HAD superfamily